MPGIKVDRARGPAMMPPCEVPVTIQRPVRGADKDMKPANCLRKTINMAKKSYRLSEARKMANICYRLPKTMNGAEICYRLSEARKMANICYRLPKTVNGAEICYRLSEARKMAKIRHRRCSMSAGSECKM